MSLFSETTRKRIREASAAIFVFAVMRNERIRVESWVTHYRNMGLRHFYVIDNGSTDGTYEFLLNQPDILVEQTCASFLDSNFGIDWLNRFRLIVGPDRWVLSADADELLVYEGWPERPLTELAANAEAAGCNAVYGFMLDMYPDGPLDACPSGAIGDLFAVAPCFDGEYHFRFLPKKPWADPSHAILAAIGGPRVRYLSTLKRESSITWVDLLIRGQIDRILTWVPDALVPTVVRCFPRSMPALYKVPLTKGGNAFTYVNSHQGRGIVAFYKQNVVLCHFKFLSDFSKRVREEAARRQHYRKGAEYIMYGDLIRKHGTLDFRYAGTQRFTGAEQLVRLGLIREAVFGN